MKVGTLIPQRGTDRMDIRFDLYDYHGGLLCGETLDVKISGRWVLGMTIRHKQKSSKVTSMSPTYGRTKEWLTNSAMQTSIANNPQKINAYNVLLLFNAASPPFFKHCQELLRDSMILSIHELTEWIVHR